MKAVFVETRSFTKLINQYFAGDWDYQEFQMALLEQPDKGDVIPGCGGLRKVRWRDVKRKKGARGGLRLIYLYVPEVSRFLLLDVYNKDEADDLTQEERKFLAKLAEEYRAEAIAASGQRRKRGKP